MIARAVAEDDTACTIHHRWVFPDDSSRAVAKANVSDSPASLLGKPWQLQHEMYVVLCCIVRPPVRALHASAYLTPPPFLLFTSPRRAPP